MTSQEANDWERWQLRGQVMFRLVQAYRCFWACLLLCLASSLFITHRVQVSAEVSAAFGISAVMAVIWYFFAIGLWHKNEYAYLRLADTGKSLSPGLHRG